MDEPEFPTPEDVSEVVNGFRPSENPEQAAKELLQQGLVPAVQQLVSLAQFGESERIRLQASQYVIERNLGKLADRQPLGDMWDELFKELEGKGKAS